MQNHSTFVRGEAAGTRVHDPRTPPSNNTYTCIHGIVIMISWAVSRQNSNISRAASSTPRHSPIHFINCCASGFVYRSAAVTLHCDSLLKDFSVERETYGGGGGEGWKVRSICDAYELRGMENDLKDRESENEKLCKVNVENLEISAFED